MTEELYAVYTAILTEELVPAWAAPSPSLWPMPPPVVGRSWAPSRTGFWPGAAAI